MTTRKVVINRHKLEHVEEITLFDHQGTIQFLSSSSSVAAGTGVFADADR